MYRILLPLAILFFACQQSGADRGTADYATATEATPAELQAPQGKGSASAAIPAADTATQRRIIRTAELRLQVADLDTASHRLQRLVEEYEGFVADSEFTNSSYQLTQNLTVRVPAERFSPLLAELAALGRQPDYQRIDTEDVTATWVDIESRLATKRAVRERYLEVLRNRAQTAEDILNAEDKIRVVTEEIEAQEARLRALRDRVAYSTIRVELYQQKEVRELPEDTYRVSFWHQVGRAFGNGWDLIKGGVLVLVTVWPLWVIVPLLVYGWRRWRRR